MSFAFLTRSLRQILPRKEIRARDRRSGMYPVKSKTGDKTRSGRNLLYFDDSRTVFFLIGTNITLPTTQQFDPGKIPGDLTASLGPVVGNVDPYAVDQFIPHFDQSQKPGPFFDTGLFEQDSTNKVNSKFMTGAAFAIAPDRFKSKVSNKTILRMEFPLTKVSQMASGSQLMYFNPGLGYFESKVLEHSFVNNGQGIGTLTFAPLPFTPYGMAYMPLNDYNLGGSFGGGYTVQPLPAEQSVQRMVTYSADGGDTTFFTVNGYTLGFVTSSVLNPVHSASREQTISLRNTLGQPFMIEKIVVEFPFQAGPGWLNDSFRQREALTSDLQFTGDAGGPMITFALMRQDGADMHYRDIIASGTITTAMDMQTGSYTVCSGVYLGGGHTTDIVITPDGVAQLGIVPSVTITGSFLSSSNNFYTGTVKLTMEPQITSHMLRTNASGSSVFFVYPILKNRLGAGRNDVFGATFGSIARRSSKYIESGRSILGNDFALLDPKKLDQANNPVKVMDAQFESQTQLSNVHVAKVYADVKSNTIKSPYLLYPQDRLLLCLSKHRAVGDDSITNVAFGSILEPSGLYAYHDVAIGTGSIKVTLYGDLIREDIEFHDTLNQRLETDELWQDVGEDPVLDQFDVAYRTELSGCYLDRFNVLKTLPYTSDVLTSSLEVTQLYSHFSSAIQDVPISNFAAWTQGKRVFELAKSNRNGQHFSSNEAFWDTRLVNPARALKIANPNFAVCVSNSVFANSSAVLYTGDNQILVSGITSAGQGIHEWTMGFPFEPKFNGVTTAFGLGKDAMPADFGFKSIFSYNDLAFEYGDTVNRAIMVGDFGSNFTTDVNPLPKSEFIKYFYGIGGGYGKHDNQHVRGRLAGAASSFAGSSSARIRGWKYGLMNGFTQHSKQVYRRDHYGQPRDMLEQRLDAKFFDEVGLASDGNPGVPIGVKDSPVQVKFYDSAGNQTSALKTLSSNVSFEATSSVPYTDLKSRNRLPIDFSTLNITNVVI